MASSGTKSKNLSKQVLAGLRGQNFLLDERSFASLSPIRQLPPATSHDDIAPQSRHEQNLLRVRTSALEIDERRCDQENWPPQMRSGSGGRPSWELPPSFRPVLAGKTPRQKN